VADIKQKHFLYAENKNVSKRGFLFISASYLLLICYLWKQELDSNKITRK
jgi:hypothetical protein